MEIFCLSKLQTKELISLIIYSFFSRLNKKKLHTQSLLLILNLLKYLGMFIIQEFLITNVPTIYNTIAIFGSIFVLYELFIILRGFLRIFLRKKQDLIKIYGEKSWALVTGSSQGIGKQFALQLAKEGFNIILLARTLSKLNSVKQEIKNKYPSVEVEIIAADLMNQGKKESIKEVLPQLDRFKNISIVVNNAGIDILSKFTDLKTDKLIDLVNINCFALTAICYKFIPYFQNRIKETGKKCGFINVGSVAGEMPIPLFNIYTASKGYVGQLTNNLAIQYPEFTWLLLKPSEVSTAMTCYKHDIFTVSTDQCVAGTLRDFGNEIQTNGAMNHKIQSYLYQILPRWLFNFVWYNFIGPANIKDRERYNKSH